MRLTERLIRRSGELSFDETADTGEGDDLRFRWIRELDLPFDSVIDFGCWTGSALRFVAPDASRRVGLDLPGPWVEEAKRRLPDAEVVALESFEQLPASYDGQFDLALFLDTLEHIPRGTELAALRTIYRSLRPRAALVLSTPLAGLAAPLDPAWILVGHRHYRPSTLTRLLHRAGFDDVTIRFSGNLFTALDALEMYAKKHALHRQHDSALWMQHKVDTGLCQKRRVDSANLWAIVKRS